MKRIALFPGQGAQQVGMARDFIETFSYVRERFAQASEILKKDLTQLCLSGPEEELNATHICQPALLVSSIAIFEVLAKEKGWSADSYAGMAGLSLGEITALVASDSLSFEQGVRLVAARGRLMQEACQREPSSMLSVIGLTYQEADKLVKEIDPSSSRLVVANVNAPTQIVLSGDQKLLKTASEKCQELGRRAIALKVAGAFHSPFMKPADQQIKSLLQEMTFKVPMVPVWSNVDGQPHGSVDTIKEKLSRQIVSPVLWVDCMQQIPVDSQAYEIGVGKVLTGLMKKINRSISVTPINLIEDVKSLNSQGALT